jgi:hypothetical protein
MALLVKPVIQVINSNGLNNVFSLKFILNTHTHKYKEGKKKKQRITIIQKRLYKKNKIERRCINLNINK